jgi:hypothetical protein
VLLATIMWVSIRYCLAEELPTDKEVSYVSD